MTTFAGFVSNLTNIVFSGVNSRLTEPPDSLESATLPAQWVQFPEVSEAPMTLDGQGGRPAFKAQVVIAYASVAQSTKSANWAKGLALVDTVRTTLRSTNTITRSKITWSIRGPSVIEPGGVAHWAIFIDITGNG